MQLLDRIERLLEAHGRTPYGGELAEPVSALAHALQCARLAESTHAPAPLIAAALLHDIGHFIDVEHAEDGVDDAHELRAVPFLAAAFGADVTEPIRLHVQAKRYLVATDRHYAAALSPASLHALAPQGGAMSVAEQRWFKALPFAPQALQLRRWDDAAKAPGRWAPSLEHYLPLLRQLARPDT